MKKSAITIILTVVTLAVISLIAGYRYGSVSHHYTPEDWDDDWIDDFMYDEEGL